MALTISQKYLLAQRFRAVASAMSYAITVIDEMKNDYNLTTEEMRLEAAKIVDPATVMEKQAVMQGWRDGLVTAVRNYAGDLVWPVE